MTAPLVELPDTPCQKDLGNWDPRVVAAPPAHVRTTLDLAARLPHSAPVPLHPDAGHGGIFQHHKEFPATGLRFLESKH
ncbi:hypothetical protein [Streptomyces sp. 3N207]|uniref:hypothetical protein n=1 Tax=Streptomyces sp. 3N207 TaxID=3457417 RepID=UPI003FD66B7C